MKKPRYYISIDQFEKLKPGDKVKIRYMLGEAYVASKPYTKDAKTFLGEKYKQDTIQIKFESGPWEGKTLELIRQQISRFG